MLYFFVGGLFFSSWSHLFPITVPVITFTPNPPSPSSQLALPNSSRDIISWDDEQLSSRITADAGRLANKAVSTRLVGLWHWVREGGRLIGWHTARACGSLSPLLWCLGIGGTYVLLCLLHAKQLLDPWQFWVLCTLLHWQLCKWIEGLLLVVFSPLRTPKIKKCV